MHKVLILVCLLFCGCKHLASKQEMQLQDTLAKLKLQTDFKPLKWADAYAFMNDYYLPRLDSQPTKRKIFIYPLVNTDFKGIFQYTRKVLEAKYSNDSLKIVVPDVVLMPPGNIRFDENFKWDSLQLKETQIISDAGFLALAKHYKHITTEDREAWHRVFGYGYMCVSYPLYNSNSNRLTIREWVENADNCGTGRENIFWFKKTSQGWQSLKAVN